MSTYDCLFFYIYIPEDTFKRSLFLVQINYDDTTILKMKPEARGDYQVNLFNQNIQMIVIYMMIQQDGGQHGTNAS